MAQRLPGPSSPLRAPHSQRAKEQQGHRKPGVDNGVSVVPRASAFLRHERRRPGEGSEGTPTHTQREAPYHACHAATAISPAPSRHLRGPIRAQRDLCAHALSRTDRCTHATRYRIPTHAKRNPGSCTHTHVQHRPQANVQPGCPLRMLNALDRRAEGGAPGDSSPAFKLLNQPDITMDRLRRPPWLNAQSPGLCHLLPHPIQG